MKKLLFFSAFLLLFASCKREYKYEVWTRNGFLTNLADTKESEDIVKEENDSLAFEKAHGRFLFLMQMQWSRDKNFRPKKYYYKLINPEGIDIASGSFLVNPSEAKKRNAEIYISLEFEDYLKDVGRYPF